MHGNNASTQILPIMVTIMACAMAVYVRIRLIRVPLERDEGEYAYMAWLMTKGVPAYMEAWSMKFPGIYYCYSLVISLFGPTVQTVHAALLVVNMLTAALLFLLGKRLFSLLAGVGAATSFAIISLIPAVQGIFANAEHFVIFFAVLGTFLLAKYRERPSLWLATCCGFTMGCAVLVKQHGVFFGIFASLYIIWHNIRNGKSISFNRILPLSIYLASYIAPLLVTGLYVSYSGSLENFWFWTMEYTRAYGTQVSLSSGISLFLYHAKNISSQIYPVIFLATAGFFALFHRTGIDTILFCLGFLFFSFLSICPGFYFREHYFVLFLPALSLYYGFFLHFISKHLPRRSATIIPIFFILISILQLTIDLNKYLFKLSPQLISSLVYNGNPFSESQAISQYIQKHTSNNETIAILGSEPQILFYAQRRSATRYIYMYPLMENHKYSMVMQKDLIAQIEESKPAYIIFVNTNLSWLVSPTSTQYIFKWVQTYLKSEYTAVGYVPIGNIQNENPTVLETNPPSMDVPGMISLFKRNDRTDHL